MISGRRAGWVGAVLLAGVLVLGGCASAAPARGQAVAAKDARPTEGAAWNYIDPATLRPDESLPKPSAAADATAFESALIAKVRGAASAGMRGWAKEADADSPCELVAVLDASPGRSGARPTLDDLRAKYPLICGLLIKANRDAEEVKKAAKGSFKRQRPADSGWSTADSYPSGHAGRAALQACLLSAVAPEKERELIKEAWFRGLCRVTLGVHYPTDVTAGFVFGEEIGRRILEGGNDRFKEDLESARREWRSKGH